MRLASSRWQRCAGNNGKCRSVVPGASDRELRRMTDIAKILSLTAACCLSSLAAKADVTYDYTGQDFTFVLGSYTTSDSVTGSFTVASALAANLSQATIVPISFSFSDGVHTITSANDFNPGFGVSTNSVGDLTGWAISVHVADETIAVNKPNGDLAEFTGSLGETSGVGSFVAVSPSPVPEPASWPVMLSGLGMAAALRLRARRRTQRLFASA